MNVSYGMRDILHAMMKSRLTMSESGLVLLFLQYPAADLSYSDIQEITGISKTSITRALQLLTRNRVLLIVGRGENALFRYQVNENWREWWNNWHGVTE